MTKKENIRGRLVLCPRAFQLIYYYIEQHTTAEKICLEIKLGTTVNDPSFTDLASIPICGKHTRRQSNQLVKISILNRVGL